MSVKRKSKRPIKTGRKIKVVRRRIKPKKTSFKFLFWILLAIGLGAFLAIQERKELPSPKDRVEISGVWVNKFYESEANQEAYISLVKTKDYHIFYLPEDKLFYISIVSYPFDGFRPLAEEQLLQILSIDRDEACKLNVDITTTMFANPDKAGEVYNLSYCE